jgi:hypothetical protein
VKTLSIDNSLKIPPEARDAMRVALEAQLCVWDAMRDAEKILTKENSSDEEIELADATIDHICAGLYGPEDVHDASDEQVDQWIHEAVFGESNE